MGESIVSVNRSLQFSTRPLDPAMLKKALAESDPQLLLMILVQLTGDTALLEAFRPFIRKVKEHRPEAQRRLLLAGKEMSLTAASYVRSSRSCA